MFFTPQPRTVMHDFTINVQSGGLQLDILTLYQRLVT